MSLLRVTTSLALFLILFTTSSFAQDKFQTLNQSAVAQSSSLVSPDAELAIKEHITIEMIMSGGDRSIFSPEFWHDQCSQAGARACRIYCSLQTEHSFNNCMNGFLWIDGCLDMVKGFCGQMLN